MIMKHSNLVVLVFATQASSAAADARGAQGEALFRQGKELLARGDVAEACAAFDASEKLDPTTSTVLNQANCREMNGQLATAWGLFLEAERATRVATDEAGRQMHGIAVERSTRLEPRLSTLTITVSDDARVAGLEVVRDADVVEIGAWNKTLPIDGGTYKVTARAPGNVEWVATVTIGNERDAKSIEVPRLKAADLAPPKPPIADRERVTVAMPDRSTPVPTTAPRRRTRMAPSLVVGGAALAMFGGAIAFELVGEATYSKSKATALGSEKQLALWHSANSERYVAEGLAAAGAAATGIATWLWIRARRGERKPVVAPLAAVGAVGVQVAGGF
jgi:hypothetical protein